MRGARRCGGCCKGRAVGGAEAAPSRAAARRPSPELREYAEGEERSRFQITRTEAAWFGAEAEEPLEAAALNPARGLADAAGVKIESGADADEDAGIERAPVLRHEFFLFRRTEADPNDVGPGACDAGAERGGFVFVEGAEWRRERADDLEAGETRGEFGAERFGHAGNAAVEVVAQTDGATGIADREHEIGAVDAFDGRQCGRAAEPDERHAIGSGEPGIVIDAAELRIGLRLGEAVGGAEADVAAAELVACAKDEITRLRERECGDADAEDVVAWRRDGRSGHLRRERGGVGICRQAGR